MITKTADTSLWNAQSIQLNLFPLDPSAALSLGQNWLTQAIGERAADIQTSRKAIQREDSASFDGKKLTLTINAGKINWIETPADIELNPEEPPSEIPSLGNYYEVRDQFITIIKSWLPSCPPIWRLGFGAKLIRPTPDRLHGYQLLKDYLHFVQVDPEGSSDMNFRVNRKRESLVRPGQYINRLVSWAAVKMEFSTGVLMGNGPPTPVLKHEINACCAELDINTHPSSTDLIDPSILESAILELVSLADEISVKGDVK